jgi:hypothetical protein
VQILHSRGKVGCCLEQYLSSNSSKPWSSLLEHVAFDLHSWSGYHAMGRQPQICVLHCCGILHASFCTRVVSKVTRSVSEGGKARPHSRFGLLDRGRKHRSSSRVEYQLSCAKTEILLR